MPRQQSARGGGGGGGGARGAWGEGTSQGAQMPAELRASPGGQEQLKREALPAGEAPGTGAAPATGAAGHARQRSAGRDAASRKVPGGHRSQAVAAGWGWYHKQP